MKITQSQFYVFLFIKYNDGIKFILSIHLSVCKIMFCDFKDLHQFIHSIVQTLCDFCLILSAMTYAIRTGSYLAHCLLVDSSTVTCWTSLSFFLSY